MVFVFDHRLKVGLRVRVNDTTIECLTFDLDDTLWACAPVIHNAESVFYNWLEQHYPSVSAGFDIATLTAHRRAYFTTHPDMSHDFSWLRQRWLERLVADFAVDDSLVAEGFQIYLAARNDVTLFPGALDTLRQVSAKYRCGSITNGNADVALIGIDEFFDFSITAAGAGASKPNPIVFDAAVAASNTLAGSILHIGDDPDRDIRGAAAVGMKTLWVNAQGADWVGDDPPDLEVRMISELQDLIENNRSLERD